MAFPSKEANYPSINTTNTANTAPENSTAASTELTKEKISLSGMRCAACAQLVEFRLKQLVGVEQVTMNYAAHKVDVAWQARQIDLKKIIKAIQKLGYGALPEGQHQAFAQLQKMQNWRLFVAAFAMMQVMMYAFPSYLVPTPEVGGDLTPEIDLLLKLASFALAIPVLIFSSVPFFQGAIRDISNRHVGMDVPVSAGILATFFMSTWATFKGGPVYFDSMIMFVFLLLSGRMIVQRVHQKSTAALRSLTQLSPTFAQYLPNFPASRNAIQIQAQELPVGAYVLVPAGAQIPADGVVIEGNSECDESWMSGESKPQQKQADSPVIGGSLNISSPLIMQAQQVAESTQFAHLIRLMESATNEKPPLVALADRHASHFLTVIMVLSVITGLVWWQIDPSRAIWIAITILVVTCPCALSLATPGVMSAVIGLLAKNGVLIAKGSAIEGLARVEHIVFDKTGTLTEGKLAVQNSHWWHQNNDDKQICEAMASQSLHPVSKALAQYLKTKVAPLQLEQLHELAGMGLEVVFNNQTYRLGRLAYVLALQSDDVVQSQLLDDLSPDFKDLSVCAFGSSKEVIAVFALADKLRPDAQLMVQQLQKAGKKLHIFSGDNPRVVARIAEQLQLNDVQGGMSPEQKYSAIQALQQHGARVAMLGDGLNDGPGLSIADVSIAMGQGAPITQARSVVLLLSNRLLDFSKAVNLCQQSLRLIKENLAWAILYNALAIPAAVLGIIEPWHAAVGMTLSSVIVVLNSTRLLITKKA